MTTAAQRIRLVVSDIDGTLVLLGPLVATIDVDAEAAEPLVEEPVAVTLRTIVWPASDG